MEARIAGALHQEYFRMVRIAVPWISNELSMFL